jgi:hypothetical protein
MSDIRYQILKKWANGQMGRWLMPNVKCQMAQGKGISDCRLQKKG